jgi:hypothetical protein
MAILLGVAQIVLQQAQSAVPASGHPPRAA